MNKSKTWLVLAAAAVLAAVVYGLCRWTSPGPGGAGRPVTVTPPTAQKPPAAVSLPPATDGQDRSRPVYRDLMRVVAPVRLPSELGPDLDGDVAETREILERFRKGGFEYAIWAVDKLPAKEEEIKVWADMCLAAFPGKVILTLDCALETRRSAFEEGKLRVLLAHVLSPREESGASRSVATPARVHSVLVNYTSLSNCSCRDNAQQGIAALKIDMQLVRSVSPNTFLWLLLDDCQQSSDRIPEWVGALGSLTDGFCVWRGHALDAVGDETANRAAKALLAQGKPVIRGGFACASPRLRRGIEQDIREQYQSRITRYEAWIAANRYAGYARVVGIAVPRTVSPNMDFVGL